MRKALVFGASQEMGNNLCRTLINNDWDVIGIIRDDSAHVPILSQLTLAEMNSDDIDFLYQVAKDVDTVFVHLPESAAARKELIFSIEHIISLSEQLKLRLVITTNKYDVQQPWFPSLAVWKKNKPITVHLPKRLKNRLRQASFNGVKVLVICCGHSLSCALHHGYLGMLIKETQQKVIIQSPSNQRLCHYWTFLPDLADNIAHLLSHEQCEQPDLNIVYYPGHKASINDIARCLALSSGKPVSIIQLSWTILEFIAFFSPLFRRFLKTRELWQHGGKPPAYSIPLHAPSSFIHTPLELALQRSWRSVSNYA